MLIEKLFTELLKGGRYFQKYGFFETLLKGKRDIQKYGFVEILRGKKYIQRYVLLKYTTWNYTTGNLGDEIQSIAAKQFLPRIDYFINRDKMDELKIEDRVKAIFNGWFTHNPDEWPPKNRKIEPLFISFHISNEYGSSAEKLTSPEAIRYYKRFQPIGCRDLHTLELLKNNGIDAYFSGCLTLTLENKFQKRTDNIYLVDVDDRLKEIVPQDIREKLHCLSHYDKQKDWIDRFYKAQSFLDLYAQAKLVITSKLHCFLPCLAFGTPAVFIPSNPEDVRYTGLSELMRIYSLEDLITGKINIDWYNPQPNPVDITPIRNKLIKTCKEFIKDW